MPVDEARISSKVRSSRALRCKGDVQGWHRELWWARRGARGPISHRCRPLHHVAWASSRAPTGARARLADRIVASQVPRDRAVGTASPADPAVAVATGARWSQSGPRPMHHRPRKQCGSCLGRVSAGHFHNTVLTASLPLCARGARRRELLAHRGPPSGVGADAPTTAAESVAPCDYSCRPCSSAACRSSG